MIGTCSTCAPAPIDALFGRRVEPKIRPGQVRIAYEQGCNAGVSIKVTYEHERPHIRLSKVVTTDMLLVTGSLSGDSL